MSIATTTYNDIKQDILFYIIDQFNKYHRIWWLNFESVF